jgi:lipopolysaccharide/colanic/teichoic acid biosynthesis glycosyltransferase/glycosyltransferase involved in cell wall biosynthesis
MNERVAIVHDWLTSMRGGERVVEALFAVFPSADLYALTWDPSRLSPALARRRVTTSAIHRVATAPLMGGRFRSLLPLFPLAVESFKLDGYSLVVSSSHCVAIGAPAPPSALHVAYVHSTLRYAHEAQAAYEGSVPGGAVGRAAFRVAARYLRRWEQRASARPHVLIANSAYTRDRIRAYYDRDARVITPPVDTGRFERAATRWGAPKADAPFLMVSALVPNKRVDLALRAFQGRPEKLIVVGEGPERARLEPLAGPNITILPRQSEDELAAFFARCRALVHTGVDDFGMVMVEALASGKPVLACAEGGALDIVRHGETGLWIETPTVASVRATLDRFARHPNGFDSRALQRFARRFDRETFERAFAQAVEEARRLRHEAHRSNGKARNGHGSGEIRFASTQTNGYAAYPSGVDPERDQAPGDPPVAPPTSARDTPAGLVLKRLADVTLAASGLMLSAPLLAILAVAIPVDSRGPALFRQRRTGLNQRPFVLVKLRTMDAQGRVTRIGRVLRPTGLDELPQLWNVLKGDMSVIGPRPEIPERVERFESDHPGFRTRHLIRPGITGWAQVNGLRGNVPIAERLRFDIEYLRERTLTLDGRILLRTVSTVVGDTIRELGG